MPSLHSIRACALAVAAVLPAAAAAQLPPAAPLQEAAASTFTVFVRGVPIGTEQSAVSLGADGWTITGTGRVGAPLDLVLRRLQVRYTRDWKPLELSIDGTRRGLPLIIHTSITGITATSQITQGGQSTDKTDTIAADALLLPSPFWSPFEALSARLRSAAAGSTLSAYLLQASAEIRVGDSTTERLQTATRMIEVRRTAIKLMSGTVPPLDVDVWGDEEGRLLRVTIPAQNVDVVREDIASVATRRVTISRPNDESIKIPSNGFSLAGTLSKPVAPAAERLPAVVLVGGSGATDRDELVFGIPVLGEVANALADAGFIVLRYDKRGVGQSGGRLESATLADYADDLRAAVKVLENRKDVDPRRLAVIGHSEGGDVALMAAAKDKKIAAVVLIGTSGVTGAELVLEQQTHVLDRSKISEADKQAKIALQKKIQQAVITGTGWDEIPPALRKEADNPEYQSLLTFDPAKVMPDVKQPILIVQGELDTQVASSNADRLEALARKRKNNPPVEVVKVPGVNHLLVPATTGEADEYASLSGKHVSPAVLTAVTSWLHSTLRAQAR
jgi:pimeloyl-ACP methyl ester carboxylesterase